MSSLAEALPKEQARVRELIVLYRSLPDGAGNIAVAMMENSLRMADSAVMSGDVIAMIQSYEDLKGYKA